MGRPTSDAAFELHGACAHSLRFSFAAPLDYPYAPAEMSEDSRPEVLFRRLQAVSPPPSRVGAPWQSGMMLGGEPFDPSGPLDRLAEVRHEEGIGGLDAPKPGDVVLDWQFDVPRVRQSVSIPGKDMGSYLLSIPYWSPAPVSGESVSKEVEYFATHRVEWGTKPRSDWVAVSFDGFWPAERDSADVIIPLSECDDLCPTTA